MSTLTLSHESQTPFGKQSSFQDALVKHFVGELEHFLDGMFERFSSGFPDELAS